MDWRTLTTASVKKFYKEGQLFLAASSGGQLYGGRIVAINDRYVELENGPHTEILYLSRGFRWASFDPPPGTVFGVADPSLIIE